MPSLDEDFQHLVGLLQGPASLAASRTDPFFYFVYPPEQALDIKRLLPIWVANLRNNHGIEVEQVSFSDLLWELIDDSGRWEDWLEAEADFDQDVVNSSVHNVLTEHNALIEKVAARIDKPRPNVVVFLTDTEMLHPYFRARVLEGVLHDRVKVPTVVLYPGRRSGQFGLHFLGFYPEDGNYRATLIGGLP